jgi:hypothetical protein
MNEQHPCLCNICLQARDSELRRAREALIADIPDGCTFTTYDSESASRFGLSHTDKFKQQLRDK